MKATIGNTHKTKMRKYVYAFIVSHREMISDHMTCCSRNAKLVSSFKVRPSIELLSHLNYVEANQ